MPTTIVIPFRAEIGSITNQKSTRTRRLYIRTGVIYFRLSSFQLTSAFAFASVFHPAHVTQKLNKANQVPITTSRYHQLVRKDHLGLR